MPNLSRTNLIFYSISIFLIILSLVLFLNTETETQQQASNTEKIFPKNEKILISDFINSDSLKSYNKSFIPKKDGMTVLYLINTDYCTPCTNEIVGYIRFISQNKNLYNHRIQQLLYVSDQDLKRSERFVKTSDFSFPIVYGFSKKYTPLLRSYKSEQQSRQAIFIDNKTGNIILRTLLPKGNMTSVNTKSYLINEASKILQDN